ncbi:hypothetical protein CICLE_v10030420mg [Citrus x clementina]|uniref:Uncharacterized protein n=1 Tax=Citrus clementina TaxID=85681 RepID=V4RUI1_CITCL|nr:hypothetical protein CICLE_v10030420mg [Citrus x clementina]
MLLRSLLVDLASSMLLLVLIVRIFQLSFVSLDDQILIIMGLIGFCITRLGYRILAKSYAASRLLHAIRY